MLSSPDFGIIRWLRWLILWRKIINSRIWYTKKVPKRIRTVKKKRDIYLRNPPTVPLTSNLWVTNWSCHVTDCERGPNTSAAVLPQRNHRVERTTDSGTNPRPGQRWLEHQLHVGGASWLLPSLKVFKVFISEISTISHGVRLFVFSLLLMAEIWHHLGRMKPYKWWDKLPINWCRISAINSIIWKCQSFYEIILAPVSWQPWLQTERLDNASIVYHVWSMMFACLYTSPVHMYYLYYVCVYILNVKKMCVHIYILGIGVKSGPHGAAASATC